MANTTNFGWETPDDTDLVKDGAAAMRTLGNSIDTSFVDLKGGTTGQVLAKASNTDLDFSWVAQDDSNAIQNAIVDAKGDLISATAADTPARLAVGANGTVLTADSAESTGLKWVAPSSSAVIQIVGATSSTQLSTTSATYVDSNLTVTITPTSASNKILVFVSSPVDVYRAASSAIGFAQLLRGATAITGDITAFGVNQGSGTETEGYDQYNLIYLDSPATTSATTYKLQVKTSSGSRVRMQVGSTVGSIIAMEVKP